MKTFIKNQIKAQNIHNQMENIVFKKAYNQFVYMKNQNLIVFKS